MSKQVTHRSRASGKRPADSWLTGIEHTFCARSVVLLKQRAKRGQNAILSARCGPRGGSRISTTFAG